jgi:hypothetical protein
MNYHPEPPESALADEGVPKDPCLQAALLDGLALFHHQAYV